MGSFMVKILLLRRKKPFEVVKIVVTLHNLLESF